MEALILTLFLSLILVALGVVLLVRRIRAGDMDHADRLSLLPLEGESPRTKHKTTRKNRNVENRNDSIE